MKITLRNDITIEKLFKGFSYNKKQNKGLYGMSGQLIIEPEYQRRYGLLSFFLFDNFIDTVINGYPLNVFYVYKRHDGKLELIDGRSRIETLGRFITNHTYTINQEGEIIYFHSLDEELKQKILKTPLIVYECEGSLKEMYRWIINASLDVNPQELLNAFYAGPFVNRAKEVFSNIKNPYAKIWRIYLKGSINRQRFLHMALKWVSGGHVASYMAKHRKSEDISGLITYFYTLINWIVTIFPNIKKEMQGVDWGRLYNMYHNNTYDRNKTVARVRELYKDNCITNKAGIYEFILSGETEAKPLMLKVIDEKYIRDIYIHTTISSSLKNKSNCQMCAEENGENKNKIWIVDEMGIDQVDAWINNKKDNPETCRLLCKKHIEETSKIINHIT